ncbi:transglycosylase SLT domain-containing protein [Uliginosibacterium sp. 31-16]|uniref:transglycosylase SLT domain-containing protein n=1 Tax=Uliginosibacterium sp. 31-16 TaxID=3068315 RepID=UPI00273EE60F|nr:transglycosylase SLT domain-containing protein [Uliginosibacterium sp. 31-16]MDP5239579.1 transglycosylase SLT domain-containing protein [Uliginosibacterium sp. 31-16]
MKRILPSLLSALLLGCTSLAGAQSDSLAISPSLSEPAYPVFSTELPGERSSVQTMDLTRQSADVWGRMRRGFGMPDLASPVVDQHLAAFTARPQAVTNILERGRKYLYHIITELEKRGMPTELALLPLVESAYNPMAFSPAKAAGLWQFIPSTGKDFQLQQNWWVDERRDVVASTNAALQYLQAVYELQGDWHLALASYNWGENAVLRAVNSNRNAGKPTDFNSLKMPRETAQYVPKLQAIKMIVAHPERYGIKLPDIPNTPYFVTVERNQGMDLAVAARLAEMPLSEFQALNPAYNRPVIPGSHDADLVLPVENARKFNDNLAAHAGQPLVNWKTYTVPRAGRIEEVAQRLRQSPDTLRAANGLAPRARLAAGYTLLIPQDADTTLAAAPAPAPKAQTRAIKVSKNPPPRALSKSVTRPVANADKPRRRS